MWGRLTLAALLASMAVQDNHRPTLAEVSLVQAWYGDPATTGADVTNSVRAAFARGVTLRVDPSVFTDTAVNHHKLLWLKYRLRGKDRILFVPDEQTLSFATLLDEAPPAGSYRLLSATYQGVDVSAQVKALLAQGAASIPVSSAALGIGDPAVDVAKTLKMSFKLSDGDVKSLSGNEGQSVSLRSILPLKELPAVENGSFESTDFDSFRSEQAYVPAGENVLGTPGTFTVSEGILRPFQLEHSIRADLKEHTDRPGSMAMWINPVPGRQPVLLWEQKVTVQPNHDYLFSCQVADISDSDSLFGTVVLEANGARSKPFVLLDFFRWHSLSLPVHAGPGKSVNLKIWRDVLPYGAEGSAALGLDDIRLGPS